LPLEHKFSFSEAIEAYRAITGACSFGTKDFVTSNNIAKKDYTIEQIIGLTKGKFGHEAFKAFFSH
jgi:hypothetical protein